MNRYEYIYREAVFMLKQGNEAHKPSALRVMLDTTKSLSELMRLDEDEKPNLTEAEKALHEKTEQLLETLINKR